MTFFVIFEEKNSKFFFGSILSCSSSCFFWYPVCPLTQRIWSILQILQNIPKLDLTPSVTRSHEAPRIKIDQFHSLRSLQYKYSTNLGHSIHDPSLLTFKLHKFSELDEHCSKERYASPAPCCTSSLKTVNFSVSDFLRSSVSVTLSSENTILFNSSKILNSSNFDDISFLTEETSLRYVFRYTQKNQQQMRYGHAKHPHSLCQPPSQNQGHVLQEHFPPRFYSIFVQYLPKQFSISYYGSNCRIKKTI